MIWHEKILKYLPGFLLLELFNNCCRLRSDWGGFYSKKFNDVHYVFRYPFSYLARYHIAVIREMLNRKTKIDFLSWTDPCYRGENQPELPMEELILFSAPYAEHDTDYFIECFKIIKNGISECYENDQKRFKKIYKDCPVVRGI